MPSVSKSRHVDKPWGYELIWAETPKYVAKILHIDDGKRLSLQYHRIKDETIYVLSGTIKLTIEQGCVVLLPGQAWHIPPTEVHRMEALEDSDVMEVSTPELDDVVRLEDDYGRA